MTQPSPMAGRLPEPYGSGGGSNLADILERVLDKGVVIAGDIRINLLDIELLTVKLRLVVASVDKAKEMGIDWWEDDPELSSRARRKQLARENRELRERLAALDPASADEIGGSRTRREIRDEEAP
ncbi:gas vesicle protein [Streptomyces griseosporeus]|uniref:gas vesicle protein n=1 Tax=Streptomyces griseosporeus TaxID=1910 RepID=UPI0036FC3340